jgi:hypothetical protein
VETYPQRFRDLCEVRAILQSESVEKRLPNGHWSTPTAARDEVEEAGFEILTTAGAQGFVCGMDLVLARVARTDPQLYSNIVTFAAETSTLPQYREGATHYLIACRATASARNP